MPARIATTKITIDGAPFELPRVTPAEKKRAAALLEALTHEYPDAHCELDFTSPHELLIATILSAQCTDVAVNKATPALFAKYPTPAAFAAATPEEIEPYIRSLGFFRMKAKALQESMKVVVERFAGQVPRTMTELLSLRGVARKTANVVLGNAFGVNDGVVVDTHVERLSKRMGLVPDGSNVQAIERRLMALFPRDRWCDLSHLLIFHGRRVCKARGALCANHPICAKYGVACEFRANRTRAGSPKAKSSRAGARSSPKREASSRRGCG
jgi:endonuclease-3